MPILLLTAALLVSCSAAPQHRGVSPQLPPVPVVPEVISEDTVTKEEQEERPLEQLPAELSLPYFAAMRLEGTNLTLESVLERTDAYVRYAISYQSNGLKVTGIMNIPEGAGPFPLLILNHGFIARSVYMQGRGLKREQDFLARAGFAVLHTDYRGHAGSDPSPMTAKVYDGNLEYAMDSANAILAVREAKLPRIDATKVGMLGHSLGGGVMLAVLTTHPELVDAAVLYAPVHSDVWENFLRWRDLREEGDRTREAFGTREENSGFWNALSPETYLENIRAPILLFQGGRDKDVPKEWSDHLAAKLHALGKDTTYVEYPGEGHEFGGEWQDFIEKTAAFFQERLGAASEDVGGAVPDRIAPVERNFLRPSDEEIRAMLTPEQYEVTQREGTERPFANAYWDNKEEGIYVDVVSGEPLFSDCMIIREEKVV